MNIILYVMDSLRPDFLSCYGYSKDTSPNIDKLAANGVLFKNAFVQQADCAASRASILSGCRPNKTGVHHTYSQYFINEFLPPYLWNILCLQVLQARNRRA